MRFRGRAIERRPGESLLRLLARRGFPLLQRSIRYHRPRGPFCGVGSCSQCLVRVNGRPNVRACEYEPADGDRIETENSWPSPRWDLLGAFDLLLPRGLDTLHGFRRPSAAAPLYQRVVRRLSGYGHLARPTTPGPASRGERIDADVLVIGGGASGRAAALALAAAGRSTVVVDRGTRGADLPGVRWRAGTTVTFLPKPSSGPQPWFTALASSRDGAGLLLRAAQVVVAVGSYDGPLLFPGNDRPGVLTGEGAEALVPTGGRPPFSRALLVGGGPRALELLERFGPSIEAVVAPGDVLGGIAEKAAALEVDVIPRTLVLGASGRSRVRRVHLRTRGQGGTSQLSVDAILLAHRRLPNPQLFYQAGARMEWRGEAGAYFPMLGADGITSVPGLAAAGSAAGYGDRSAAEASGRAAADALLGRPWAEGTLPPRPSLGTPGELEGYYRELLHGPRGRGKWILCPCEDVLLHEVEAVSARGFRGIEVVKRMTAVGTGLCQGRYCLPDALLVLAILEARSPAEVGYITQRPPVWPTSLATLAALPDEALTEPEAP